MKRIQPIIFLLLLTTVLPSMAKPVISDLFKTMPDSLMPYLSQNNRLDMIDFMEARMKAEVTNLLDGKSEMTLLTDDSLSIRLNAVVTVDLKLVERSDSSIVCMQKTYKISEHQVETIRSYYSSTWCPLSLPQIESSTLLKRDDELFTDDSKSMLP